MRIVVLASGSKGNCTYIETPQTKILIDVGISFLQVRKRLNSLGVTLDHLDGIFISHEHSDHVKHLEMVLKYYHCPLFIHEKTYNRLMSGCVFSTYHAVPYFIKEDKRYQLNDLEVMPLKLSHDAVHVLGFICKEANVNENLSFASVTDTGILPEKYISLLSEVSVLLFESNHDVQMLQESNRPYSLIRRILSNKGHMSNIYCDEMLKKIVSMQTKIVVLAHISEECNTYDLAYNECMAYFNNHPSFILRVAKQKEALPIIEVNKCFD